MGSVSNGALLDLVAKGTQDKLLIGNPQLSYFKQVYKRSTNFALDSVRITIDGGFAFGTTLNAKIPRTGDLLSGLTLELDFPELTTTNDADSNDQLHSISYIPNVGYAAIDYIEFKIEGQSIDKQYGEWMYIWSQLSKDYDKRQTYSYMTKEEPQNGPFTAYIPLQLWFCRNYGSALPLIALQYHNVELDIKLKPLNKLYYYGDNRYYNLSRIPVETHKYNRLVGLNFVDGSMAGKTYVYKDANGVTQTANIVGIDDSDTIELDTVLPDSGLIGGYVTHNYTIGNPNVLYRDIRLFGDIVMLDTEEQKLFAKSKHNYLIEQIKFNESDVVRENDTSATIKLDFNLSVKEFIWVKQITANINNNLLLNFESTPDSYYELPTEDIDEFTILYNGNNRITPRKGEYFRLLEPLKKNHTNVPHTKYIYCYSFALFPEKLSPSGISNLSRIDDKRFKIDFRNNIRESKIKIYAVNYNILRIEDGMGGVMYSN
jgi:hypothetical protein